MVEPLMEGHMFHSLWAPESFSPGVMPKSSWLSGMWKRIHPKPPDCKGGGLSAWKVAGTDLAADPASAWCYFQLDPSAFRAGPMQEICLVLKAEVLAIVHSYLWPFMGLVLL